ncbi:hypothetical protein LRS10_09485 [Phenylobacterium sp. J426]|uniref:hypothetical protein n=1 Tax=Phenylobacterium sp. J426 TaxID=2898439 RepID=UPI0021513EBB|nr:hypothetical protein [Phenylobacterium sp. J426]MCR5874374.1 hypothetical protein [Phenylobacterium sp. J426]
MSDTDASAPAPEARRRIDRVDIVGVAGLALLTVGFGMIYLPLAFIVSGGALVAATVLAVRRG